MARTSLANLTSLSTSSTSYIPPLFLAPAFASLSISHSAIQSQSRPFSSSLTQHSRPRHREKNKSRGVSAIRRTGPRVPLSISKYALPVPVTDPPARKDFKTNPEHGLWGFFNEDRTAMTEPEAEIAHGRAWTYAELQVKSFEDLHGLYWVCVKERNRMATDKNERARVFAGYGDYETESRDNAVVETMNQIREVLRNRWFAWQEARAILEKTPVAELDLDEDVESYEDDEALQKLEEQDSREYGVGRRTQKESQTVAA